MGMPVVAGGMAQCSFGGMFQLMSQGTVMFGGKPVLTIEDMVLGKNLVPMGTPCSSPSNPQVAAALGAPQPCTAPPIAGMWVPGCVFCQSENMKVVDNMSKLMCSYGGVISVTYNGTQMITVN